MNSSFAKLYDALMEENKPLSKVSVTAMLKKHVNLRNDKDTKAFLHLVHKEKMRLMFQIFWGKLYGAHVPVKNRWKNAGERIDDKRVCAKKSSVVRFYERVEKELVKRLGNNIFSKKDLTMSFPTFY